MLLRPPHPQPNPRSGTHRNLYKLIWLNTQRRHTQERYQTTNLGRGRISPNMWWATTQRRRANHASASISPANTKTQGLGAEDDEKAAYTCNNSSPPPPATPPRAPRCRVAAPREHSPTRRRGRSNNNKLISTKKKQKRKKIKDRYDWKAQQERPKAHFSPTYKAKAWGPLQPNRLDWRGPDEWPRLRRCRAWSAPFDPSSDGQDHSRGNPRRDREAGAAASISRRRRIPRRLLLLPLGFRLASPAARLASSTVRSPRFATAIVLARLLLVANLVFAEFFDTYVKFCGFLMTCRSEIIEIDWVELGGG